MPGKFPVASKAQIAANASPNYAAMPHAAMRV